jgi:hydroxymethylpyrimidine/phosphomethylpyrimidine kinase
VCPGAEVHGIMDQGGLRVRMRSVICIGGSDSGGASGLQADLRALDALGLHGLCVVTAVTAQSSTEVREIYPMAPEVVTAQLRALWADDYDVGAVKVGMLATSSIVRAVVDGLRDFEGPIVLDPVIVSSTGRALLDAAGVALLRDVLLPRVTLLTPNLPEARQLLGEPIVDHASAAKAVERLAELGCEAVLLKGGHFDTDACTDVLWSGGRTQVFTLPRLPTPHTRGTGCTTASLIAGLLAQAHELPQAVQLAKREVYDAIARGERVGRGAGPVRVKCTRS